MGRLPLIFLLLVTPAITISGQTRAFDNFDAPTGVTVSRSYNTTPTSRRRNLITSTEKKGSSVIGGVNLPGMRNFTTGDPKVDSYIAESSARYNIDPLLIYAQMHQESSFRLRAISNKGARGLMQLMPATAVRFGVTDIFDPRQNIEAGVRYMRWLLDKFDQNLELALAGYNAGEGAVMRYGNMIPPYRETREYVRRISLRYASVTDPTKLNSAKKVSPSAAALLIRKESRPLYLYEPSVFVVRTPDGRAMLINH